MPLPLIPLLLGGAALFGAGVGVKKGFDAKADFDKAESVNSEARSVYDTAQKKLENVHARAQRACETLGKTKFNLMKNSLLPFQEAMSQIRAINFKDKHNIANLTASVGLERGLRELNSEALTMKNIVGGGVTALGSGGLAGLAAYGSVGFLGTASSGAAIGGLSGVAATNATLAWLGGGSLAAGGFGMAGGMMVLGGIVAAPILAVGGIMLASKAEEAKENAYSNLSSARMAAEQMETAATQTYGIQYRFDEINSVLSSLNSFFLPFLQTVKDMTAHECRDYEDLYEQEQYKLFKALSIAVLMKNIMDAPILTASGDTAPESAPAAIEQMLVDAQLADVV